MENAMAGAKTPTHILVDCGYVNHPDAIRLSREFVSIATQHPGRKEEVKEGRRNERRSDYR